jgi:hypothetical protein
MNVRPSSPRDADRPPRAPTSVLRPPRTMAIDATGQELRRSHFTRMEKKCAAMTRILIEYA